MSIQRKNKQEKCTYTLHGIHCTYLTGTMYTVHSFFEIRILKSLGGDLQLFASKRFKNHRTGRPLFFLFYSEGE